ncbi:hypothetical protein F5Y02DRAFT_422105 [Annulohypoxylon stygium]|nr:hypothetical protein F5Y02DRAFT_422105 [Annulohypoxylon stygium]
MVVFYEDVVGEGGQEYSVRERPHDESSRNCFVGSEYTSEEDAVLMLREFVSPLEVEINPRSPTQPPPSSKFTLPAAFLQAQAANALAKDEESKREENGTSRPAFRRTQTAKKKAKDEDEVTLNDLWYESGMDWDKVKPAKENRKNKGMEACTTGPECFTCGSRLSIKEVMSSVMACRVCHCFN